MRGRKPKTENRKPRQRVLIIEDDADNREALRALLEMDGYEVRIAADGPEGIRAVEEDLPDVALVDVGLPGMSGYDVCRELRRRLGGRPLRLVALTGYGHPAARAAARAAGFDHHLAKPVRLEELSRALSAEDGTGCTSRFWRA